MLICDSELERYKLNVMLAWEKGEDIQYETAVGWVDVENPQWIWEGGMYRVKPKEV